MTPVKGHQRPLSRAKSLLDLFPLTPLGSMVAASSYVALRFFAYALVDRVLLVVGYSGLCLCAMCALTVALAAAWLRLRPGRPEGGDVRLLETGVAARTGFWLPALRWVPLLRARWSWEYPQGADVEVERVRGQLWEVATLRDRGQVRQVRRRLVVEDVLGISRVAFRRQVAGYHDVLPRLGRLGQVSALLSMAGGDDLPHPSGVDDGDRLELQRYLPGDPARFIHWKVLARTRKLMVRAPERALSSARRTSAFMVAGNDDDASAAAARAALQGGVLGDEWRFGSDLEIGGASETEEALGILMRSSGARDGGGAGLGPFVEEAEKLGPSAVIVFAPPLPGEWMARVRELARRRRMQVVIACDSLVPAARPPLWQRLLLRGRPVGEDATDSLLEVVEGLSSPNCRLTVLDRETGRPLPLQHLRSSVRARDQEPAISARGIHASPPGH